jgi:hypothetical protein
MVKWYFLDQFAVLSFHMWSTISYQYKSKARRSIDLPPKKTGSSSDGSGNATGNQNQIPLKLYTITQFSKLRRFTCYRLTHWKLFLAFAFPGFFLSTTRESLVKYPAVFWAHRVRYEELIEDMEM